MFHSTYYNWDFVWKGSCYGVHERVRGQLDRSLDPPRLLVQETLEARWCEPSECATECTPDYEQEFITPAAPCTNTAALADARLRCWNPEGDLSKPAVCVRYCDLTDAADPCAGSCVRCSSSNQWGLCLPECTDQDCNVDAFC